MYRLTMPKEESANATLVERSKPDIKAIHTTTTNKLSRRRRRVLAKNHANTPEV
jgi:hypothetical protein